MALYTANFSTALTQTMLLSSCNFLVRRRTDALDEETDEYVKFNFFAHPPPSMSTEVHDQDEHATTSATISATNEPKSTATYVTYLCFTLELPIH